MRVVCNLTSIPPRFKHLQKIVDNLSQHEIFDEIVVHVPRKYNRFSSSTSPPKLKCARINMVDEDYGAGTRIVYGEGDVVVYCDDDTYYDPKSSRKLLSKLKEHDCVVSGSGFNFKKYLIGDFSKIEGESVQVVEGYGMVMLKKEWVDKIREEFKTMSKLVNNDDYVLGNLLEKYNIPRRYFEVHLRQYDYGFDVDALHYNDGEKTHLENYKRMLRKFRREGILFYKPVFSYAICVCDERAEIENLLYILDDSIMCDEIRVLVDTTKITDEIYEILYRYKVHIHQRQFDGNFGEHKNYLNSMCKGEYIFNIDADEIPSYQLTQGIYKILQSDAELVFVPRVNILQGASFEFLKACNFRLDTRGFINWPDLQGRIYKNSEDIKWSGMLHERLSGIKKNVIEIQHDPNLALWHVKSVQRMKKQDAYYKSLEVRDRE